MFEAIHRTHAMVGGAPGGKKKSMCQQCDAALISHRRVEKGSTWEEKLERGGGEVEHVHGC